VSDAVNEMSAMERAKSVRVAAFDVDGILTDGRLYYTDSGEEIKSFNVQDGQGIKMLRESGIAVAIITSRSSRVVENRARDLGIEFLFQGVVNKLDAMNNLLKRLGFDLQAASYMGDDVIDLPVLRRCRFAASVPEAPALVRKHAHYVTRAQGGCGAVREFAELIVHAQGPLDARLAEYLV
jgi:3-deoxy-D-manno-octulosonate 8-phosphate phosphatase (KDO 8-P phosphatase)